MASNENEMLEEAIRDARARLPASLPPASKRAILERLPPLTVAPSRILRRVVAVGLVATAAAAAVVVVVIRDSSPGPDTSIVLSSGHVDVEGRASNTWSASNGADLAAAGRVRTGSDGGARLRIGRDHVALAPATQLRLARVEARETLIELDSGRVELEVAPRRERDVAVVAGDVAVRVKGTVFAVARYENRVHVSVIEGVVSVATAADVRDLEAPAEWEVESAGEPAAPPQPLERPASLQDATPQHLERPTSPQDAPPQHLESPASPQDAPPQRSGKPASLQDAPPQRSERPASPPTRARNDGRDVKSEPAAQERLDALLTASSCREAASLLRAESSPASRAEGLRRVADCYYRARDHKAALATYDLLVRAHGDAPQAEGAAYERGKLAMELGARKEALRHFRYFLRRYPDSMLASEASFRVCRLLYDGGQHRESLECITHLRRAYPDSGRVGESHMLEATIKRVALHDCAGAIAAYDAYLSTPGAELERQAREWREWCAAELRE